MLYWRMQGTFSKTIIVSIIVAQVLVLALNVNSSNAAIVKKRETTISINDHDIVQHNDGVDNNEAKISRPIAFGEKVTKLLPQSNDDDDNDDDDDGGSSLFSERGSTGRLILNKVSQESKEEKADSISDDKEREASGESLEKEIGHAAIGIHFTTEGIKPIISSNMSDSSQQNHAKVISAQNEFTTAFAWQTSTPRVDESHANISTTNVRSVPELIMSTTLTTQDIKDIEEPVPKVTTASAPKLIEVSNSLEDSNEIRMPVTNTTNTSEKRAKFFNDHTTNSQQLNLPDATEVWTLAGMKAVPKSNATSEHKEDLKEVPQLEKQLHRENITLDGSTISPTVGGSSNSEKNLLDWTQIMMSGELDTTKYDGLMEHSTQTSIVTSTQPQTSLEVATIQSNITSQEPFENRTEGLLNVTVDATDENTELVTKETTNQTVINMESTTLSSQLNEHINTNVITTTTIESTTEANEVILTKTALPNATNNLEFTTMNPTLSLAETRNNNNTAETLSANDEDKHDEHNNNNTSTMSNIDDEPQNANKTTIFDPTQRAQVEESTENSSVMESMTTRVITTTTALPSTTVVASATTPLAETIALNSSGIDEGTIHAFTPTSAPVLASTETTYTRNVTLNANYNDDSNVTATSGASVGVNVDANVDAGVKSTADVHTHATTTVELSSSEMTTVSTLTTGVTNISTIANVSEVVTGDVNATTSKIIVNETSTNTPVVQGVTNLANDTGEINEHSVKRTQNKKGNSNTNIEQIEKPIKSENDTNVPETTISSYANELLIHKTNYTLETEEATTETTPKRATDASVETSTTTTTTAITKTELFKTIDEEQTKTTPTTTIAPVTTITTTPVAVVTLDPVLTKPTGVVHGQISHETESSLETNDIDATDSKTAKTNNLATSTAATTTTTSSIIDDTNIARQQQHNKSDFPLKEHQANTLGEEEQQNNEDILLSHITTTPATTMDIVTLNILSSTTTTTISPIISTLEDKTISSSTTTTSTEPPLINLLDDTTTTTTSTLPSKSTKVEEIYSVFPSTSSEKTTSTSAAPLPTTSTPTSTNAPNTSTAIPATQLVLSTVSVPITTTMLPPLRASIGGGNVDLGMMPTSGIPMGMPTSNLNADSSDAPETDVNVIIAISVSVIGVVALILLVAFLYLMRKRQKQMSYGQRCRPVSLDAYSLDNVSVLGSVRRKGALRASKRSYGNAAFDDPSLRHNVLNAVDLTKFVERRSSIFEEFREVPQIHARADEVPAGCEDKNRYANVVPLPETRVILQQQNDDEKTEYINANYVRGPKDPPNYYIACQAPLESTVADFWRMIWEQQSRVIIQATDLSENGIEKCAEYLPPSVTLDNHTTYGDFQVTLKNRDVKDRYAISTLLLKNTIENASRELTHYWYKWPEMGVPTEEAPIIAMLLEARSSLKSYAMERASELKEQSSTLTLQADESSVVQVTPINAEGTERTDSNSVNVSGGKGEINGNISNEKLKITTKNQGPLTVHCSPGTGRTGTIIACDMAIRSFETPKRSVDIPQIVYYVRRGRASAVQTKEQYEFIYKVTSMYATKITNLSNDN